MFAARRRSAGSDDNRAGTTVISGGSTAQCCPVGFACTSALVHLNRPSGLQHCAEGPSLISATMLCLLSVASSRPIADPTAGIRVGLQRPVLIEWTAGRSRDRRGSGRRPCRSRWQRSRSGSSGSLTPRPRDVTGDAVRTRNDSFHNPRQIRSGVGRASPDVLYRS